MRVGIVNDLALAVEALRRVVAGGGHEIAWIARDGAEAVDRCAADTPDLVLMDLIMPVMNGVQATAAIMQRCPCAILVVTATVSGNAAMVFEAMGWGALDATGTPVLGPSGALAGADALLGKIAMIGRLLGKPAVRSLGAPSAERPWLVAIGSSTGGPRALAEVLASLPRWHDSSVVIVQHVDSQFAAGLAEWLSGYTEMRVTIAQEGVAIEPGVVFLAATNDHLVLGDDLTLRYTIDPLDQPYRPSVDVFFASVGARWPAPGVAVLLTGMGRDGANGLRALRLAGWHTIAQDERTSVVYGMPRAAAEIGAAAEVLPVHAIGPAIVKQHDAVHPNGHDKQPHLLPTERERSNQ